VYEEAIATRDYAGEEPKYQGREQLRRNETQDDLNLIATKGDTAQINQNGSNSLSWNDFLASFLVPMPVPL